MKIAKNNKRHIDQSAPFNSEYFKNYYESYRDKYDDLFPSEKHFINDFAQSNKTILDVGCAVGGMYKILSNICNNIKYVGADVAEELIEIARVRFPKVRFEISDGVDLPFSDREFDRVLTFGTTVHDILFNDLLTSCYRVCSEYLLFDIRLSLNLQTLNQIEKAYVLDGAGKKYPYVVVSWNDFNNWLSTLSEAPTEVNIYGYWGEANKDTNLPAGYEKICMACVLIKKPPVKEVGKQKTKIQIDLPKEFINRK